MLGSRGLGIAIALAAGLQTAGVQAAAAADLALVAAPARHIWLGHFSGGRNLAPGAEPTALDWADVTERFGSMRECAAWMRSLKRTYSTYDGFRTCLLIR